MRTKRDTGPVETSVMAAAVRFAVAGRAIVVLACTALLPWGAALASSAAVVAGVVAWQAAFVTAVSRARWRRLTAAVDGGSLAAACVLLPYAQLPHGYLDFDDWARQVTSVVVVTGQWYTRVLGGLLITMGTAAAVVGGAALTTGDDWNLRTAHAVTLLWQGALSRCLVVLVARGARRVDELTGAVAAGQRVAQLAAARRADIESHVAQLHDTVAATLTAAASRGAGGPGLLRRARSDLSRLTPELRLAAEEHDAVPDLTTPPDTGTLRVTTVLLGLGADPTRRAEAMRTVPAYAVRALAAARDEALRNVERHAGTGRARVELRLPAAGVVALDVIDDGPGFEPADVGGSRGFEPAGGGHGFEPAGGGPHFGLRLSIGARMRRAGGDAQVVSAPGRGTRVTLRWPAAGREAERDPS